MSFATSQLLTLGSQYYLFAVHTLSIRAPLIANPLQPGKRAIDLIRDFLSCLWEYAKDQITREIGAVADLSRAMVVL